MLSFKPNGVGSQPGEEKEKRQDVVMVQAYNLRTWEVEAQEAGIQGRPQRPPRLVAAIECVLPCAPLAFSSGMVQDPWAGNDPAYN